MEIACKLFRNIFLYLIYCKNVFSKELTKRVTGYFFRAISIERGQIIRNLFLLVFRVNEGKRRVLKRSRPWAKGRIKGERGVLVAPEVAGAGSRKTKGPVLKRRALKTTMSLHFNDLFFGCALPFKSVRLQVCGPRAHGGQPHRAKGALKASRTRVACDWAHAGPPSSPIFLHLPSKFYA